MPAKFRIYRLGRGADGASRGVVRISDDGIVVEFTRRQDRDVFEEDATGW
jgi:hypothetical protein